MKYLYPIRLNASLEKTRWGGHRLQDDGWKVSSRDEGDVGESWETKVSEKVQNGPYAGLTLQELVQEMKDALLGKQAITIFGERFPLLAKFIDAHDKLSVQVHPDDQYAKLHENGKLGKTEFWYILAAEPGATIVHGFKAATLCAEVQQAIQDVTLEALLHEEVVQAGDVIFVPAGTVHAIGKGVLLYELQEYSDVTYRLYDYGWVDAAGKPRELHIERSLDVAHYDVSRRVKVKPVVLGEDAGYEERCLVACKYFVTREMHLKPGGMVSDKTNGNCVILSSLGADAQVRYGNSFGQCEALAKGQTLILPAELGDYRLKGIGVLLRSYVPFPEDEAWRLWRAENGEGVR